MSDFESSAKLFKTLMHPARLEILDVLRDGEHCVCHIEAALGYRQAYISQHLMVLREAGLVQDRRDGWNIFYRVVQPAVYAVIDAALRTMSESKTAVRRKSTQVVSCTCPTCQPLEKMPA
ncbi:MAG: metalloregulator ArsR/SmtB family transcription factor [Anaerolineae bacterium]